MTYTQTVEIPANRRVVIEVPREIPAGTVTLTLKPAPTGKTRRFGCAEGQFRMAADFDAPLDDFKDYE